MITRISMYDDDGAADPVMTTYVTTGDKGATLGHLATLARLRPGRRVIAEAVDRKPKRGKPKPQQITVRGVPVSSLGSNRAG